MAYLEQHRQVVGDQSTQSFNTKENQELASTLAPQEQATPGNKDAAQFMEVASTPAATLGNNPSPTPNRLRRKDLPASTSSQSQARTTRNKKNVTNVSLAVPIPPPSPHQKRQRNLLTILFFCIIGFVVVQIIWVETMMNPSGTEVMYKDDLKVDSHGVHNVFQNRNFLQINEIRLEPSSNSELVFKLPGGIRPLSEILIEVGNSNMTSITGDFLKTLPSSQEVESLYGSDAVIYGSNSCAAFRAAVPEVDRYITPAGMFNTGTNLLMTLLQKNCYIKARMEKYGPETRGIRFQVPWGKHSPVNFRKFHKASDNINTDEDHVLPVLIIKDPYTWMTSMCRHTYAASWWHDNDKHCPNLVLITVSEKEKFLNNTNTSDAPEDMTPTVPASVHYPKESPMPVRHHKSLLHIWKNYYEDYINATGRFPFIAIRFEDLLFRTKDIIKTVCDCAGGTMEAQFSFVTESAKKGSSHEGSSGFRSSIARYGNATMRREPYMIEDLNYAKKVLSSSELMNLFQYKTI